MSKSYPTGLHAMNDQSSSPLHDPSYLLSTVETIADSVQDNSSVTCHDLVDAYHNFSYRLKSQSHVLQDCATEFPALKRIVLHKVAFCEALRRDIKFAHTDPFAMDGSLHRTSEVLLHYPIQRAREMSFLCNHALCALAVIFKFPCLSSLFTAIQLVELFADVLSILLAKTLPVFNGSKTFSLSLWILRSQRLPLSVIGPQRSGLVSALRYCLHTTEQSLNTVVDVLKASVHVLNHHKRDLFGTMSQLLPYILDRLSCKSTELRLLTTNVLVKFAASVIHEPNGPPKEDRQVASTHVIGFLREQAILSEATDSSETFLQVIRLAFEAESQTTPGEGPTWIATVLASLIVLSGPSIFCDAFVVEFVLGAMGFALTHKESAIRALHPCIWKCLIWVYARMLSEAENYNLSTIDLAFRAVCSELHGRTGTVITSILLRTCGPSFSQLPSRETWRLKQALSIIQRMADQGHILAGECTTLLRALITTSPSFVNIDSCKGVDEILPIVLFDGTILNAHWDELPAIMGRIPRFTVDGVCPLTRSEVALNYQTLFDAWCQCILHSPSDKLDGPLVEVWRSLLTLLVESHPNTQEVFKYAATSLTKCLPRPLPRAGSRSTSESWNTVDQICQLLAIKQLWSVLRDLSATWSISDAALLILSAIWKCEFTLPDSEVRRVLSTLSVDLMAIASSSSLDNMRGVQHPQVLLQNLRGGWGVISHSLQYCVSELRWEDLLEFLSIPVCMWVLSESEVHVWESLFRCTMSLSSGFDAVVNRIAGRLEAKGHENLESAVQVLAVVLSSFSGKEYLPPDTVLTAVNRTLSLAYDQHSAGRATSKSVLRLLTVIREHITGSLPEDVVVLLAALRTGLGLWIEDKMEIMTVDDFNSVIIPLYCDTLQVLERLPLSSATLQNIESFLASGFSRIPTPAIAPFAFEKFWRATYYGQTQFYEDLPPSIKFCLLCFVAAYGGDLAFGLSVSTESQTQDSLILLTTVGANSMIHVSSNHGVDQLVDEDNIRGEHDESIPSVADMTFILLSDHYTREHPALRRLQHYASGNVISSPDEELADHQQLPSKSILRYLPESPIPEAECPLGQAQGPRKRGQVSDSISSALREVMSEPISRANTPLSGNIRLHSAPTSNIQMVFDCVEVPTFRSIVKREKMLHLRGTPKLKVESTPAPRTAAKFGLAATVPWSPLPPSVCSEDEGNARQSPRSNERTSSEIAVDESLAQVHESSPLKSPIAECSNLRRSRRVTRQIKSS